MSCRQIIRAAGHNQNTGSACGHWVITRRHIEESLLDQNDFVDPCGKGSVLVGRLVELGIG